MDDKYVTLVFQEILVFVHYQMITFIGCMTWSILDLLCEGGIFYAFLLSINGRHKLTMCDGRQICYLTFPRNHNVCPLWNDNLYWLYDLVYTWFLYAILKLAGQYRCFTEGFYESFVGEFFFDDRMLHMETQLYLSFESGLQN